MRLYTTVAMLVASMALGCGKSAVEAPGQGNHVQLRATLVVDQTKPKEVPKEIASPLECTIQSSPTCVQGEAPKILVKLTNRTNDEICLVSYLDGSECKMRYPHCSFEVKRPVNTPLAVLGRCGNTNTLLEGNFVRVPKGGAFNPFANEWDGSPRADKEVFASSLRPDLFKTPGVYKIRFVYSTNSDDIKKWGGDGREKVAKDPKLVELFDRVPKTDVISNEIEVTVVAK